MESSLRTEVRGRRQDCAMDEEQECSFFSMGNDVDFEGLQVPPEVEETYPTSASIGRSVAVNNIFDDAVPSSPSLFDRNIGESSEEED